MSNEELIAEMTAAGHFPQVLEIDCWSADGVVETTRTYCTAPLIRTFRDRNGRWIVTVFGEWYYQIPSECEVPAVTSELLRAMDSAMNFPPDVIRKYGLIPLPLSEFPDEPEFDDE